MANTIQLKRSSTASNVPTAGELAEGELAINTNPADRKLYSKDSGGTVFEIGASGIGGSIADTQIAYGSGTDIAGESGLTWTSSTNTFTILSPDSTESMSIASDNTNWLITTTGGLYQVNGGTPRFGDFANAYAQSYQIVSGTGQNQSLYMYDGSTAEGILIQHDAAADQIQFASIDASVTTDLVTIDRSTGDITSIGDVDGATIGGITSANLLDKSATETVSGAWVFTAADTAPSALQSKLTQNRLYLDGKNALDGNDTWLRLNNASEFSSGTYTPYVLRVDGGLYYNSTQAVNNMQYGTDGFERWTTYSGSVTAGTWYTIATDPSGLDVTAAPTGSGGGRAASRIMIWDHTSGQHGFAEFQVVYNYGRRAVLHLLRHSGYGGDANPLRGIRIVRYSTYDGCAIQVNPGQTGTLYVAVTKEASNGFYGQAPAAETPNATWYIEDLTYTDYNSNMPQWGIFGGTVAGSTADLTGVAYDGTDGKLIAYGIDVDVKTGGTLAVYDSSNTDSVVFSHDGSNFNAVATGTSRFDFEDFSIIDLHGATLRIRNATEGSDYVNFSHDGTDFNAAFTLTTSWNITGVTDIAAGTVDADFDAITATSYGGITEANLLDKTAAESISNDWNWQDNIIQRPELKDFGVTHTAPTVSGNAVTVNCANGNSFLIDMDPATANVTLTLSNPPASGTYGEVNLMIVMGTPSYDITWPGSVTWLFGGSAPVLTTTNDEVDIVHLFTVDGGTTWYGTYALSAAGAAGDVSVSGTPADNQVAVWTSSSAIEGTSGLTYNGTTLSVTGDVSGTTIGGITEANLVDKTAAESISAIWSWTGAGQINLDDNVEFRFGTGNDVTMYFGGTNFITTGVGSWNLSGFTALSAGTVDADFDAITATSYGGITEANLLDKSATETVSGTWTFSGAKTTMNQLFINESSAADADVAGDGQFWVKNDAPNTPWFTDDAGNDYPLGYGAYKLQGNASFNMTTASVAEQMVNAIWYKTNTTAYTLTLETSSTTNFPVGAQLTIVNAGSSANLSVVDQTTNTCYVLDGSSKTDIAGTATIAPGGYATLIRISTTETWLMGAGVTA